MKKNKILSLIAALVLTFGSSTTAVMAVNEKEEEPSDKSTYVKYTTTVDGREVTKYYVDESKVIMQKEFKSTQGVSPEVTFEFKVTKEAYKADDTAAATEYVEPTADVSNPDITISEVKFNKDAATTTGLKEDVTITLPTYEKVGEYYYYFEEDVPTTEQVAGVTYSDEKYIVKVQVMNAEDGESLVRVATVQKYNSEKSTYEKIKDTDTNGRDIHNEYESGNLVVTKKVEGLLGDKKQHYEISVTINNETEKTGAPTSYTVETTCTDSGVTNPKTITAETKTTFYLKNDESITIENLPYGTTYTVEEKSYDGYTTTYTATSGVDNKETADVDESNSVAEYNKTAVAVDNVAENVVVTNTKGGTIDTGVITDNAPYIALIGLVVAGAVVFFVRKRNVEE